MQEIPSYQVVVCIRGADTFTATVWQDDYRGAYCKPLPGVFRRFGAQHGASDFNRELKRWSFTSANDHIQDFKAEVESTVANVEVVLPAGLTRPHALPDPIPQRSQEPGATAEDLLSLALQTPPRSQAHARQQTASQPAASNPALAANPLQPSSSLMREPAQSPSATPVPRTPSVSRSKRARVSSPSPSQPAEAVMTSQAAELIPHAPGPHSSSLCRQKQGGSADGLLPAC